MISRKTIKNNSIGIQAERDIVLNISNIHENLDPNKSDLSVRSVKDIHFRSNIAVELFKIKEFNISNLKKFILDSRTASEIQFILRLIRGISYITGNKILGENDVKIHIFTKLNKALQDKDYLSAISLINVIGGMSLKTVSEIFKDTIDEHVTDTIFNIIHSINETFTKISLLLNENIYEQFETPMNITYDKNLKKIKYNIFNNKITHTIYNPNLVWDCNCDSFDTIFNNISKKKCKIHSKKEGVIVNQFSGTPHTIFYDNIDLISYTGSIWPPSIDTLYFLQFVRNNKKLICKNDIKYLIDIGSGTGILAIYLKKIIPSIEKVTFTDINPEAIKLSKYNYIRNFDSTNDAEFIIGKGTQALKKSSFDYPKEKTLLICMPPYLAYPETWEGKTIKKITYSAIKGIDLLKDFLENYNTFAHNVIIGFSSLAGIPINKDKNYGLFKSFSQPIPMRILTVLYRPNHLNWLLDNNYIYENLTANHRYWHKFVIYTSFSIGETRDESSELI